MIYFIYDSTNNAVKIGKTSDDGVYTRLSMLQIGNPTELKLLGVMPGYTEEEEMLHEQFNTYRIRGEWFKYINEVKEFILSNVQEYNVLVKHKYKYDSLYKAQRKYSEKKREKQTNETQEQLSELFIIEPDNVLTVEEVKQFLKNNKVYGNRKGNIITVTKLAEFFNATVKTIRWGANKQPTRCIVGVASQHINYK